MSNDQNIEVKEEIENMEKSMIMNRYCKYMQGNLAQMMKFPMLVMKNTDFERKEMEKSGWYVREPNRPCIS